MNIAVICHGAVLQPALEALESQGLLAGVAVPGLPPASDPNLPLEAAMRQAGVPFLRTQQGDLSPQLGPWLEAISADLVCCMGFPRRIPQELLGRARYGFYNFHGAPLPAYRGPDPAFWLIRNREPHSTLTIHRMTPEMDAGGIAHQEQVAIHPTDTHALYLQRLGAVLPRVLIEFVQQVAIHGADFPLREQESGRARWLPRPTEGDRTLDWGWRFQEIDALVRACNPVHGGAFTRLRGVPIRVLEVEAAPAPPKGALPGTVLGMEPEGLRVACGEGESLRIGVAFSMDGFFTGRRMAQVFALRVGDRLG